jgi:signal transduction histidine kinase
VRLQEGRFRIEREPVDLVPMVVEIVELIQATAERQLLRLDSVPGPLIVAGDPRRLRQLLLNLLTNALTHAPDTRFIDVRLRPAEGRAELEVQDYGPGIPPADLPHLFARYYQTGRTAARGLGLGLYIAREIVQAHEGTIEARSQVGRGATFIVHLPLA